MSQHMKTLHGRQEDRGERRQEDRDERRQEREGKRDRKDENNSAEGRVEREEKPDEIRTVKIISNKREEIERKRRAFEKEMEEEEEKIREKRRKMREAAQEERHQMKKKIEEQVQWEEEDWGGSPMVEILENMDFPPDVKSLTPVYNYEAKSKPGTTPLYIPGKTGQDPVSMSTNEETSTNHTEPADRSETDPAPVQNDKVERTGMDPVLQEVTYAMDFIVSMVAMSCPVPVPIDVESQCNLKPCGEKVSEGTITNIQQKLPNSPPYVLHKIDGPLTAEGTTYDQWCRDPRLMFQAAPSSYEDCYESWLLREARRMAIHQRGRRARRHLPVGTGYVQRVESVHLEDGRFYSLASNWFPDRTKMNGASKGCQTYL